MGAKRAEHQAVIAGSPHQCFEELTDYESMADWQSSIKRCEVRSRDAEGRGSEVLWELDAKIRSVTYVLAYRYEPPSWIGYSYVDGDIRDVEGEYTFEDRGDGTTLATLSLRIDPGMWVPGPVAALLGDQVLKRSLEDLKGRVEAASAAA